MTTEPARTLPVTGRRRTLAIRAALCLAILLAPPATCAVVHQLGPTKIDRRNGERPPRAEQRRRVVLFVLDGLAPRYLEQADAPALHALADAGLVALHATTAEPATSPGLGTILSGLPPGVHGFGGCAYAPWKHFEHATIYSLCAEHGLRCGFFTCKPKLATLVESEPGAELYVSSSDDSTTLDVAARYLVDDDADFALVHLCDPDSTGHNFGWGSARQLRAIERLDAGIEAFLARIDWPAAGGRPLAIQVVSDHGGRGHAHHAPIPEDVNVVWFASGSGVPQGAVLSPVTLEDTAPTVLALLGLERPKGWWGHARLEPDAPRAP